MVIISDLLHIIRAKGGGIGDAPSTLLTIFDAVILGNALSCLVPNKNNKNKKKANHHVHPSAAARSTMIGGGGRRSVLGAMSLASGAAAATIPLRPRSEQDRAIRIFASTFNVGSSKSIQSLGQLEEWIPPPTERKAGGGGFDLYVIGIQECNCLADLKQAIHQRIGK